MKNTYKDVAFLLYGYDSEYVLREIHQFIQEKFANLECINISSNKIDNLKRIKLLLGKKIIFITSAHILEDRYLYQRFFRTKYSYIVSPLEIISYLKPIKSIFIAHDLVDAILDEELPYVHFFDHIVVPQHVRLPSNEIEMEKSIIKDVGWVKYTSLVAKSKKKQKSGSVFFLSDISMYMNYGFDYTYNRFQTIFRHGIPIKLPAFTCTKEFEERFKKHNVKVIPSNQNSIEVINQYQHIFTNGLSSISVESILMGKKISLIRETFYPDEKYYLLQLAYPEMDIVDDINNLEFPIKKNGIGKRKISPFNPDKLFQYLLT